MKLHETTFNPENFYTMILTLLLIGADLIILVMREVILGERRGERGVCVWGGF